MYEINEINVKFAYLKLKKYIYYYTNSNYLKDKIIKFEEEARKNENIFTQYAQKLNEIGNKKYDCLKGYRFSVLFYPKKDCFKNENGVINVNEINAFIDMDLIFFMNDVLF